MSKKKTFGPNKVHPCHCITRKQVSGPAAKDPAKATPGRSYGHDADVHSTASTSSTSARSSENGETIMMSVFLV